MKLSSVLATVAVSQHPASRAWVCDRRFLSRGGFGDLAISSYGQGAAQGNTPDGPRIVVALGASVSCTCSRNCSLLLGGKGSRYS